MRGAFYFIAETRKGGSTEKIPERGRCSAFPLFRDYVIKDRALRIFVRAGSGAETASKTPYGTGLFCDAF